MLVETVKLYWSLSQRLRQASSDASKRLIIDHEVTPAAAMENDPRIKNRLLQLVAAQAAA